mmetsp:Transcript_5403/g.17093  ORF Transcript_5403/g.17093 Transcript_5403/m.17093 type:complete len:262 (+) Transcript_5403:31-816(+)
MDMGAVASKVRWMSLSKRLRSESSSDETSTRREGYQQISAAADAGGESAKTWHVATAASNVTRSLTTDAAAAGSDAAAGSGAAGSSDVAAASAAGSAAASAGSASSSTASAPNAATSVARTSSATARATFSAAPGSSARKAQQPPRGESRARAAGDDMACRATATMASAIMSAAGEAAQRSVSCRGVVVAAPSPAAATSHSTSPPTVNCAAPHAPASTRTSANVCRRSSTSTSVAFAYCKRSVCRRAVTASGDDSTSSASV